MDYMDEKYDIAEHRMFPTSFSSDGLMPSDESAYSNAEKSDLPAPVRAVFDRILEDGNAAQFDEEQVFETTYRRIEGDNGVLWVMGVHEEDAPFNPSGYNYYVQDDGTYVGFEES